MRSLVGRRRIIGVCLIALPLLFSLPAPSTGETLFVTPTGGPGYDETGTKLADVTRKFSKDVELHVAPGDVVQLLAETPEPDAVTDYHVHLHLLNVGGTDTAPITIRGLGSRTRIVGKSLEELGRCAPPDGIDSLDCKHKISLVAFAGQRDLLETVLEGAPDPGQLLQGLFGSIQPFSVNPHGSSDLLTDAACIDLDRVDGIVVEHLAFDNCWLSAVRALKSRHVVLRSLLITGGSYGLAIKGKPLAPAGAITVEDVTWIQDTTGFKAFSRDGQSTCADGKSTSFGCAGDMWRRIPWGSSHHGSFEHLNGALLGGVDVAGPVIFRRNKVLAAYNGIRLKAKGCENTPAGELPTGCPFNSGVWIYDNVFSYVRDNPVELEVFAKDAKIFHNTVHNSHAWFSFDGMGGGPVYVYGNQGWFDDMPVTDWSDSIPDDQECSWHDTAQAPMSPARYDPAFDRRFNYMNIAWYPVGMMSYERDDGQPGAEWMNADQQPCDRSLTGRVIKLALPPKDVAPGTPFYYASTPIYVFNNSWFLRAPIASTGAAANLRHWNNAIAFCEPGVQGYDAELCDSSADKAEPSTCGAEFIKSDDLVRYPAESGTIPFFDCFRWLPYDEAGVDLPTLKSEFDYDVSSNGFPLALKEMPDFESRGRHADPGFANAAKGDFSLVSGAAASQSGCLVAFGGDGSLTCRSVDPATSYAGAVSPEGTLYPGPAGKQFQPPN